MFKKVQEYDFVKGFLIVFPVVVALMCYNIAVDVGRARSEIEELRGESLKTYDETIELLKQVDQLETMKVR